MADQNQWTLDDYNAGKIDVDRALGWSPQESVDYYNRYHTKPADAAAAPGPPGAAPAGPPPPPNSAATDPADRTQQQGLNSQTYSPTPEAAPTQNTTNQGTQDVVRNSYLQQAEQGTAVDTNDPNFRQQADAYAAAQERARRTAVSQTAEQYAGSGATGAQTAEERLINEQSGQNQAGFEAQLVGHELQNRRSEIQNALTQLGGMISGDQARALQKQLADIDAQLKQAGLDQSSALGQRELDIRQQLGLGGLNVDLMRLLTQNQQYNNDLGFRIGSTEAGLNQSALDSLLG